MITMKDFIAENNPILRQEAEPVSFPLDEETQELITEMREFLINSQDDEIAEKYGLRAGVGLAAPQLGVSKQIFAVYLVEYTDEGERGDTIIDQIFINPKIKSHAVQKAALRDGEGCLSVPHDVPGFVPRPRRVTLEYRDEHGEVHTVKLRDYEAIVVQHEMDHLKGILFYDHIDADQPWRQGDDLTII
ncbi:peptide deformylase [Suicoccus acidiformans]|uniref:Peptide deformylase n=1 Tax=Suicoccus acidiformans TaxID=2036206 RepID=A0A347WJD7_9LACT|nr:peptide deformylase [Suicoccus acidiformans]AXY25194.1 peptide deformylase [Suicoccus acidiformans]